MHPGIIFFKFPIAEKTAYGRVLDLTRKYKGMKKLIARFEAAAVAENLDDGSLKWYNL